MSRSQYSLNFRAATIECVRVAMDLWISTAPGVYCGKPCLAASATMSGLLVDEFAVLNCAE